MTCGLRPHHVSPYADIDFYSSKLEICGKGKTMDPSGPIGLSKTSNINGNLG
jgi:hypothetical protein